MYLEDENETHRVIDNIMERIKETGLFYKSIFNDEFGALEVIDQNFVLDVVLTDFGYTLKGFIDTAVQERLEEVHK
ncbi:hypothetical protein [Peribacillus frigoritolerans]|uniref:hypothetical protein n=1 Tax=Peribacillus frigoritolerans TaxID=450367 RepID=UPI0025A164A9|nr:hypothetical protein [Peribacillus frigoritolerans]MDM5306325.1 hypothetical protein [Peribacillus frigoritolerans]